MWPGSTTSARWVILPAGSVAGARGGRLCRAQAARAGVPAFTKAPAVSQPRSPTLDPLGPLLSAIGVAALVFLPFVLIKANRIVPGEARTLLEFLSVGPLLAFDLMLALAAGTALFVANARWRLAFALLGVIAVTMAVAAAGNALTPPGKTVVRVAPGAGFWVLLIALGLMTTDAITRLRPGPAMRVLLLALFAAAAGLALDSGALDHLSIMREYAVDADRFARQARQHVLLAFGSLAAAVVVGLPFGILWHLVLRSLGRGFGTTKPVIT